SGVGASVGVKGARITAAANGTTYVTVGSHGFYYRQRLGRLDRQADGSHDNTQRDPADAGSAGQIPTADVETLKKSTSSELVEQLNQRARISWAPAFLLIGLSGLLLLAAFFLRASATGSDVKSIQEGSSGLSDNLPAPPPEVAEENRLYFGDLRGKVAVIYFWTALCKDCQRQLNQYNRVKSSFRNDADVVFFTVDLKKRLKLPPQGALSQNLEVSADVGGASATQLSLSRFPIVVILDVNGLESSRISGPDPVTVGALTHAIVSGQAQKSLPVPTKSPKIRRADANLPGEIGLACLSLVALALGLVQRRRINDRRRTTVVYELDSKANSQFAIVQQAFGNLSKATRLWRITSTVGTYDWKRNAGSTSLINRQSIRCGSLSIPDLSTNISVIGIDLGEIRIYPLPDQILYWQGGKFAPVLYADLRVSYHHSRYIETESMPSDARVIDRTWRYVNKDGGPDRRFSNNAQLPVDAYGGLNLASVTGLNLDLQVSSLEAATNFASLLNPTSEQSQSQQRPDGHAPPQVSEREEAAKVLGIKCDAGIEEVATAYRNLAQMYHPDKVASLAPEFQALADRKMKEINLAYALLKRTQGP
ncbi:MAG: DUF4236 domain-containing protein, partial [Bryobacteraceae bacterium]